MESRFIGLATRVSPEKRFTGDPNEIELRLSAEAAYTIKRSLQKRWPQPYAERAAACDLIAVLSDMGVPG